MKHPVECLKIECNDVFKEKYELVQQDIQRAGSVEKEDILIKETDDLMLDVILSQ